MRFRRMARSLLLPAGIVWVAAVAFGLARMLDYEFTPGAAGAPSRSWPTDSSIRPDPRRANLVIVAHPRCPCTRASIDELAHIMTRARGLVAAHVLFYRPGPFPSGWERTDLWQSAAGIPGVTVLSDPEGCEAQRFGAVTSGHVLLYDRAGRLLFTGGITGSRGHAGDNIGCDSVIRLLTRGAAPCRHTSVYGCPILRACYGSPRGLRPAAKPGTRVAAPGATMLRGRFWRRSLVAGFSLGLGTRGGFRNTLLAAGPDQEGSRCRKPNRKQRAETLWPSVP